MKIIVTAKEIINTGNWDVFCKDKELSAWAINEGQMDSDTEFTLAKEEAQKYALLPPSPEHWY